MPDVARTQAPAVAATASTDPRPTARVLIDAVQGVVGQAYPWERIDVQDLLMASLSHGVTPALAVRLRGRDDVPAELTERLQACYRDQLARHLRTLADLRRLSSVLNETQMGWAVVKGPALAEGLWPRPDLRVYVDLDVLIDRRNLREAVAMLEANGVAPVDRNWPFILERVQGELSMELPFGTPLDLHWHLVNDRALRRVFRFPMDDLLGRSAPAKLGSVVAPVLDPVDTVLHLAYHMIHSGGHRLVWLNDFHLAVTAPGMDWDELYDRAQAYGCRLALALSLQRTASVLHPPGGYPRMRRGGPWAALAAAADRWRPVPQLPGEKRSGRIVFQSTRDQLGSSAWAASLAALGRTRHEDALEAGAPNPLHLVVSDPQARRRYFDLVAGRQQP